MTVTGWLFSYASLVRDNFRKIFPTVRCGTICRAGRFMFWEDVGAVYAHIWLK